MLDLTTPEQIQITRALDEKDPKRETVVAKAYMFSMEATMFFTAQPPFITERMAHEMRVHAEKEPGDFEQQTDSGIALAMADLLDMVADVQRRMKERIQPEINRFKEARGGHIHRP